MCLEGTTYATTFPNGDSENTTAPSSFPEPTQNPISWTGGPQLTFTYTCHYEGTYKFIKRLSVDINQMANEYAESIFDLTELQTMISDYQANIDYSGCYDNCDEYCDFAVPHNYDIENGDGAWAALLITDATGAQDLIDQCKTDCNNPYEAFDLNSAYALTDPFMVDEDGNPLTTSEVQCTQFYNQMEAQVDVDGIEFESEDFWLRVNDAMETDIHLYEVYFDNGLSVNDPNNPELEKDDYFYDNGNSSSIILPTASTFNPYWIPEIVKMHREYCHYEICEALLASEHENYSVELATELSASNWSESDLQFLWGVGSPPTGTNLTTDPFKMVTHDGNTIDGYNTNDDLDYKLTHFDKWLYPFGRL